MIPGGGSDSDLTMDRRGILGLTINLRRMPLQADTYKHAKEAFVADLQGTTGREVMLPFALMPVRPMVVVLWSYDPYKQRYWTF